MIETAKNLLSAIGLGTPLIVSVACTGSSDTTAPPASPTPDQAKVPAAPAPTKNTRSTERTTPNTSTSRCGLKPKAG